ncbi:MAG: hypothetical protein CMA83_01410 [Euryarchaeota archaeon]|jgi:hypothetical protein|nr:hypothetical protein [Euryarchaeota archaeon]|tara:strand:+ start:14322 stop:15098 length:777 start_codon:yes stop_codon:yes gene_type:complete
MEILIKVGDSGSPTGYKDGDIVEAFSTDRILKANAETICSSTERQLNDVSGLNASGTIHEARLIISSEYKFVRVGSDVERTNLITGEVTVHNKTTDERIDVDEYLRRRLLSASHNIFGNTGSEYWYGGSVNYDSQILWDEIENRSDHLRVNNKHWHLSPAESVFFFPISCCGHHGHEDDISHSTAELRTHSVTEDNGTPEPILIARREWMVPYWDLATEFGVNVDDIRNSTMMVDARLDSGSPHLDDVEVSKTASGLL